ncbi:uncharacterized protein LOC131946501 isoform X2 [Physella acuta]|uniref:uncharacterized protein LOC131946501 isoform X2 n=1 Tax=Physella acuta TaxID=109671 RepID=UPI0027DC2E08|nr:uncharacterized protein LOC131946501 isoform X2 [Physella acuta]
MDERSYSSLSRHGLGSSYSYLDGVPFKISTNFRLNPEVVTQPELIQPIRTFTEEYTFETEEGVLAWAKAREEAIKQAELEIAEKQKLQAAEREKLASAQDAQQDTSVEENGQNMYDVPINQVALPEKHSLQPKASVELPKPTVGIKSASEPGMILKPTPIHSSVSKKSDSPDTNQIDVSMFESEADPFDNLELQTINEMEELKVVLDSSSKCTPANGESLAAYGQSAVSLPHLPQPIQDADTSNNGFYDTATVVPEDSNWADFSEDRYENLEEDGTISENTDNNFENNFVNLNPAVETTEDEYVEINNQAVLFQNNSGVIKSPSPTGWGQANPALAVKPASNLANSKIYKPVLPPINKPDGVAETNPFKTNNPFLPSVEGSNPFLPNTLHNSDPSSSLDKQGKPIPPPISKKPILRNRQSGSGARMWSSVDPSMASSFDESSQKLEHLNKNPYSRHSLSSTDLQSTRSSSEELRTSPVLNSLPALSNNVVLQPLNKHRPLPPPPSPKPKLSYNTSQPQAVKEIGLGDPYHSLSREAQIFTDNLTSMGFLRARVARAVEKFGQDEREVLDHLLAVDQLVEKKYAPVIVESALHKLKNNTEKNQMKSTSPVP